MLDKEERELAESIEKGEWKSVENLNEEIRKAKEIARATLAKDQRMNIRIAKRDLNALKVKAIEEGIPYQTLVSSLIHKYLSGQLIDKGQEN
ncbi:MAG: antitoxin [Pseudomonadota bacterium]